MVHNRINVGFFLELFASITNGVYSRSPRLSRQNGFLLGGQLQNSREYCKVSGANISKEKERTKFLSQALARAVYWTTSHLINRRASTVNSYSTSGQPTSWPIASSLLWKWFLNDPFRVSINLSRCVRLVAWILERDAFLLSSLSWCFYRRCCFLDERTLGPASYFWNRLL